VLVAPRGWLLPGLANSINQKTNEGKRLISRKPA
jgi:hypothetical protein